LLSTDEADTLNVAAYKTHNRLVIFVQLAQKRTKTFSELVGSIVYWVDTIPDAQLTALTANNDQVLVATQEHTKTPVGFIG